MKIKIKISFFVILTFLLSIVVAFLVILNNYHYQNFKLKQEYIKIISSVDRLYVLVDENTIGYINDYGEETVVSLDKKIIDIFSTGEDNSLCFVDNEQILYKYNFENKIISEPLFQNVKKYFYVRDSYFVITNKNELYVWGKNDYGQLGLTVDKLEIEEPIKVLSNIVDISSNSLYTLALDTIGDVYEAGYIFIEQNYDSIAFKKINDLKNVNNIHVSSLMYDYKNFAITESGEVYNWSHSFGTHNKERLYDDKKRANSENLTELGVKKVIGTCAVYIIDKNNNIYYWGEDFRSNWKGKSADSVPYIKKIKGLKNIDDIFSIGTILYAKKGDKIYIIK